jgi:cell division protein FtsA
VGDGETPVSLALAGEEDPKPAQVTTGKVREVVHSRVKALHGQITERLERAGISPAATERVVLTGGAGQLPGLSAFLAEAFRKPVRAGHPQATYGWPAGAASPAYSTVLGLAQVAFDPAAGVRRSERQFQGGGYLSSVGRWLQASF